MSQDAQNRHRVPGRSREGVYLCAVHGHVQLVSMYSNTRSLPDPPIAVP